jgi:hypothetical protein
MDTGGQLVGVRRRAQLQAETRVVSWWASVDVPNYRLNLPCNPSRITVCLPPSSIAPPNSQATAKLSPSWTLPCRGHVTLRHRPNLLLSSELLKAGSDIENNS